MDLMKKKWHRYHYKNLTLVAVSLIIAILLLTNPLFRQVLIQLGNFGYIGAFIGGLLFCSTFTASIGTVILMILAENLHPLEIGIIAGAGAVCCDLMIFHFIRNKGLISEINHFFKYFGGDKISHIIHTKYFSWMLPVIGAIIIASPLPDELGVSLIGISKMKTYQFIILSFILNSVGIFLIVTAAVVFRP